MGNRYSAATQPRQRRPRRRRSQRPIRGCHHDSDWQRQSESFDGNGDCRHPRLTGAIAGGIIALAVGFLAEAFSKALRGVECDHVTSKKCSKTATSNASKSTEIEGRIGRPGGTQRWSQNSAGRYRNPYFSAVFANSRHRGRESHYLNHRLVSEPHNGRVFFDRLGRPGPKHGCTGNRGEPQRTTWPSTDGQAPQDSAWREEGRSALLSPRVAPGVERSGIRGDCATGFVDLVLPRGTTARPRSCAAADPARSSRSDVPRFRPLFHRSALGNIWKPRSNAATSTPPSI